MRKTQAKKLPLAPDAKYNDMLVTRFVNNLMWEGKKNTAYNIFYDALDKVNKQTNENGCGATTSKRSSAATQPANRSASATPVRMCARSPSAPYQRRTNHSFNARNRRPSGTCQSR